LEVRPKFSTGKRIKDLLWLGMVAAIFGTIFILIGLAVFKAQDCKEGFFTSLDVECLKCSDFLGETCLECSNSRNCILCDSGFFLENGQCYECEAMWEGCDMCTKRGCLQCVDGFYLDGGICKSCSGVTGCKEGSCTSSGCTECLEGFYLDGKQCKECNKALPGCKECNSDTECTLCTSEFLTVEDGKCECIGDVLPHMIITKDGSCDCEDGYWLTENGC